MSNSTSSNEGDRTSGSSSHRVTSTTKDLLEATAIAIPAMLFVYDSEGLCEYASRRWFEYTGTASQQPTESEIFAFVHPEDRSEAQETWKKAIETGKKHEMELRFRRHDGAYRWHRICGNPEKNAEGRVQSWVVVCIDVEEQRQKMEESAELHITSTRTKEELERVVKERTHQLQEVVEQLEAFAYSIAHDMRAPLRAMHQYAEVVARDFSNQVPKEAANYLNRIMAAAKKLDSLIREVLIYTRVSQGAIKLQPTNLERVLSEVLVLYPQLNPPHVEMSVRLPLHAVIGDETALTQAFSNLLTNAVKFMPPGRKPLINIWTERAGDKVKIYIKDNGIGIASHDRDRIFKMFERLQPQSHYEGSGIGLTIVRRAVERMGGIIGVDSTENEGSTFWIELDKGEP